MALNSSTANPDFVQRTAESRRIVKALVGRFTFDQFYDQHRGKVFLSRNMTQVLAFHDRIRTRGLETGTFRSSSSRTRGPFLGINPATTRTESDGGFVDGTVSRKDSELGNSHSSKDQDSPTGKPDVESMSQDCLKVKTENGSPGDAAAKRRSVRHQLARQHEDRNAQLYLDIVNIRKKLNFKENTGDADQPPRKRARRESIPCHCHVTIWDNRQGLKHKEPIVRKSEVCEVSTTEQGAAGFSADIRLRKPFVFKSSELNVPLRTPHGTVLGIGDQYFLEIKILPTKDDVDWPPIPVLGRSEGDQTTGLGRMAAQKLQGTLVARYLHLPQAPASDVPLSVFYLHESRTYRSKYGLEVRADWARDELPESILKREEDDTQSNLWTLDDEGRNFGRAASPRVKDGSVKTTPKTRGKQTTKPVPPVKVTFNIDTANAKGAKDFRKSGMTGLGCPACPKQTFSKIEELQFHFLTLHSNYKFTIEKEEYNDLTKELISLVFKISTVGVARPRMQEREPQPHERDLNWQAPTEPLDLPAFVDGDQTWVEQHWSEGAPKKLEPTIASLNVVHDRLSSVRQKQHGGFAPAQKGGFLPAEHVLAFRESNRERFPNVKLRTMTTDKNAMYTSISHRQVHIGEEARSESDDEMDDGWFVKKSLEALDVASEKQGWTDEQRLLRRKWNQARLGERLSHPRYLSDCLIRFVGAEKSWLKNASIERKTAFAGFLDEFLQRRVINQEVVRDLWTILHEDDASGPVGSIDKSRVEVVADDLDEAKANILRSMKRQHTSGELRAELPLHCPPYTCAVCLQAIEDVRNQGVHCSEHDCETPGVWYHNRCIRCKRKDKLSWKCHLCTKRVKAVSEWKGKEVLVD